jgi:hypothetical protein
MTTAYHLFAKDAYCTTTVGNFYACGTPAFSESFGYYSPSNFLCDLRGPGDKCSACVEIATLMQLADATL